MNEKQLLELEKITYPIGSKFIGADGREQTWTVNNYYYCRSDDTIYSELSGEGGGPIYRSGIWAGKVSDLTNNYPIF